MLDYLLLVERGLEQFYMGCSASWRQILDTESVTVELTVNGSSVCIEAIYYEDGTRQIAAPRLFDSRRCVWALRQVLEKGVR
ncbi:hypothetical protein D3C86_1297510 [compost metagenome]